MDSTDDYNGKRKKGGWQHKIFKLVILIIVAIFFYLILSFIYIEFFKSATDKDYVFELNLKKYDYLYKKDQNSKKTVLKGSSTSVAGCILDSFYYEHVSQSIPCIINKNKYTALEVYFNKLKQMLPEITEKEFNSSDFLEKIGIIDFSRVLDFNRISDYRIGLDKNVTRLTNREYLYFQILGETEIYLSPISQLKLLKPLREDNKHYKNFTEIISKENLESLYNDEENKDIFVIEAKLNFGDMLYVPAFYFSYIKNNSSKENLCLELIYNSTSRVTNTMMKVLLDDDLNEQI